MILLVRFKHIQTVSGFGRSNADLTIYEVVLFRVNGSLFRGILQNLLLLSHSRRVSAE